MCIYIYIYIYTCIHNTHIVKCSIWGSDYKLTNYNFSTKHLISEKPLNFTPLARDVLDNQNKGAAPGRRRGLRFIPSRFAARRGALRSAVSRVICVSSVYE